VRLLPSFGLICLAGVLAPGSVLPQASEPSRHGFRARPNAIWSDTVTEHFVSSGFLVSQNQGQHGRSLAATGAFIGGTLGMVVGYVVWENKQCYGLDCGAKIVSFPFFIVGYGVVGGVIGYGIGYGIGSIASSAAEYRPTRGVPMLRLGVSLFWTKRCAYDD